MHDGYRNWTMPKAIICPTITAFDTIEYKAQIERVQPFAKRIHIDLMDGEFAPTKSPELSDIWWPTTLKADIHLMYQRPLEQLEALIELRPDLIIIHQEAEVDHASFTTELKKSGIRAGLALLSKTSVESAAGNLHYYDHVLIFSGDLGRHGGEADLSLLSKAKTLRKINQRLEIAWDGGINDGNAAQIIAKGVDVLNVGGFVQDAESPADNYQKLDSL